MILKEKSNNYHSKVNDANTLKLRSLLDTLPPFCKQFFRGIEPTTSSRTRLGYALDLRIFFEFVKQANPSFKNTDITSMKIDILDSLKRDDIEEYLDYLSYYEKEDRIYTNDERGKARKLAALRSFYSYFYTSELIEKNVAALVPMPKLHEKEIIRLDPDEVSTLLDLVESGENLSVAELRFHKLTKVRDLAILTLLLGTGIRVSECVGLDLNDVDFKNEGIRIQRKGGYIAIVYFGDEVKEALLKYMDQRKHIIPESGHENALFLSLQYKRLAVRSIEKLVQKYASRVTSLKKITPHKLRSTYGTSLYKNTGDIYLVADVLGHKDVNTTKKHYAAQSEERRKQAANKVQLRGD